MPQSLSKELRKTLEKTTLAARTRAESAARAALENLAVHEADYRGHMSLEQRQLRNRLRARGRALGDLLDPKSGKQSIKHLAEDAAYEHWHRLLFTRFLAENHLLHTDEENSSVPITIAECEELAPEMGAKDGFDLACRFASRTLPGVFRRDDPVLDLTLALNDRVELRRLLDNLPADVFTADDSLGWTYQFWQAAKKKEVNESGTKIGADEISPVTQLFTEDYMVEFLLHNTLGAWWAGKLGPIEANSEEEARNKAGLTERDDIAVAWTYLRFVQEEETKTWSPAAGVFDGWPKTAKEITFLDPCMGSGHFLVFALPILARLRMEEENISAKEAVHGVLRDNIHGLELDPRCCQIGAFNLALTAWKCGGYQPLPPLHVACCGLAPQGKLADWIALAGESEKLQHGMEGLYRLFEQAPVLGSLINPRAGEGDLLMAAFHELQPLLEKALAQETKDDTAHDLSSEALAKGEMAVTARGLAKAAEILAGQFTLVATNVPFLKRGYQKRDLSEWIENHYEIGKANIATAMLMRANEMAVPGGSVALVIQQSWLYQSTQRRLREQMLATCYWNSIARLGPGAFDTISGEVVNVALVTLTRSTKCNPAVSGVDVYADKGSGAKATRLREGPLVSLDQAAQSANPQSTVMFPGGMDGSKLIGDFCDLGKGSVTGDSPHFIRQFWEQHLTADWEPWLNTPEDALFSGRHQVVFWQNDGYLVRLEKGVAIRGQNVWGRRGFLVGKTSFASGIYLGEMFDDNTGVLAPASDTDLAALLCFSSSDEFEEAIRDVDQELKVTIGNFGKITVDLDSWRATAAAEYPKGLPKPRSANPTQWLFNGHPLKSDQPLHVVAARLLGYQWPRQSGSSFPDCPALGPDGLEKQADEDGIVCLPPINREQPAAARLRTLLNEALGPNDERALIAETGSKKTDLEAWLREEFFAQHCKLFRNRPFVWHIWDGRKDGFAALVNYHKLDHANLQKLAYSYLGDWIRQQEEDAKADKPGAAERLAAARVLQTELANILKGEPPYDIFVRWKPLKDQSLGWNPNLNDGVRLNIRPFMLAKDLGKKDAGLLRAKPNIHWKKDRGNEPKREKADYPWFWSEEEPETDSPGGAAFTGNRWNNCHYTLAAKNAARGI